MMCTWLLEGARGEWTGIGQAIVGGWVGGWPVGGLE